MIAITLLSALASDYKTELKEFKALALEVQKKHGFISRCDGGKGYSVSNCTVGLAKLDKALGDETPNFEIAAFGNSFTFDFGVRGIEIDAQKRGSVEAALKESRNNQYPLHMDLPSILEGNKLSAEIGYDFGCAPHPIHNPHPWKACLTKIKSMDTSVLEETGIKSITISEKNYVPRNWETEIVVPMDGSLEDALAAWLERKERRAAHERSDENLRTLKALLDDIEVDCRVGRKFCEEMATTLLQVATPKLLNSLNASVLTLGRTPEAPYFENGKQIATLGREMSRSEVRSFLNRHKAD